MKKALKIDDLEIKLNIIDVINISSVDEKTKAQNFQDDIYNTFNYCVVRQIEKFL